MHSLENRATHLYLQISLGVKTYIFICMILEWSSTGIAASMQRLLATHVEGVIFLLPVF